MCIYYVLKKREGNCKLIITVSCVCLVNSVYFLTSCLREHSDAEVKNHWSLRASLSWYTRDAHAKDGAGWWDTKQRTEQGMTYLRLSKIFSPGENLPFLLIRLQKIKKHEWFSDPLSALNCELCFVSLYSLKLLKNWIRSKQPWALKNIFHCLLDFTTSLLSFMGFLCEKYKILWVGAINNHASIINYSICHNSLD